MRDKTHNDFIERWAKFVKENPTKWQKEHTKFINSQFQMAYDFIERLKKTKNGKEKIKKIYKIGNEKGYPKIFS